MGASNMSETTNRVQEIKNQSIWKQKNEKRTCGVEFRSADIAVLELVQNLFPDRQHDFVLSVSESDIVIIKQLGEDETSEQICALAENVVRSIQSELHIRAVVGIGTTAYHLRELADRYKEAQVAIEVGRVFEQDKPVIHYENLGIGRIIYQLPVTLQEKPH